MAWAQSRRRSRKRGWFGRIVGWIIRAFFIFVIGSLLWVLAYRFVPPPITFTMIGDLIEGRGLHKQWMSLDEIDRDMPRAAIAGEDGKFCHHRGFDTDAIVAAMRRNAEGGRIRGGSTISQQTAKNAFLWQNGGYFRKGLEAWFTLLIEQIWGKRRIMEVYLNLAETGIGTYGVNAGAQRYFGHDASNMTSIEAARIAAVLPLPKKRGAIAPQGFARRYGNMIAARMGVVSRDSLDGCIYRGRAGPSERPMVPAAGRPKHAHPAPPQRLPGEEYEQPQGAMPPVERQAPAPADVNGM